MFNMWMESLNLIWPYTCENTENTFAAIRYSREVKKGSMDSMESTESIDIQTYPYHKLTLKLSI